MEQCVRGLRRKFDRASDPPYSRFRDPDRDIVEDEGYFSAYSLSIMTVSFDSNFGIE